MTAGTHYFPPPPPDWHRGGGKETVQSYRAPEHSLWIYHRPVLRPDLGNGHQRIGKDAITVLESTLMHLLNASCFAKYLQNFVLLTCVFGHKPHPICYIAAVRNVVERSLIDHYLRNLHYNNLLSVMSSVIINAWCNSDHTIIMLLYASQRRMLSPKYTRSSPQSWA